MSSDASRDSTIDERGFQRQVEGPFLVVLSPIGGSEEDVADIVNARITSAGLQHYVTILPHDSEPTTKFASDFVLGDTLLVVKDAALLVALPILVAVLKKTKRIKITDGDRSIELVNVSAEAVKDHLEEFSRQSVSGRTRARKNKRK